MSIYSAVDLFAGPGGWDVAYNRIGRGRVVIGVENDQAAWETRSHNGLATWPSDVRKVDPVHQFFMTHERTEGLIASPPCQTFSQAGKGAGRAALDKVLAAIHDMNIVNLVPYHLFDDVRTGLVLEPLRWAIERVNAGKPFKWIALEQVPGVLPVWEAYAVWLRGAGYSVVTSVVSAEQYGVPQTRKRAVLLAHLTRDVKLPAATHRKYRKGVPQEAGDPDLKPWVSMADALGWDGLVGFPRKDDGREAVEIGGTAYRARDLRSTSEPAQVVTEKARSWTNFCATNLRPNATLRGLDEPAPTLAFGHEKPRWLVGGTGTNATVREVTEPADTVHFGERLNKWQWTTERPATTVCTTNRVAAPGHRHRGPECCKTNREGDRVSVAQFSGESVRVTPEEAATLQSFPADFKWQGTRTKQFQQIGNAIPPLLAEALLREVIA